ncbi:hypothetical protein [Streptomyces sp. NPDC008121]|uniref:hypothetical protein n=1 Tax=Streptomyces sp. NPDC008121 TaxID=3364809 RepID=UPI0036ED4A29
MQSRAHNPPFVRPAETKCPADAVVPSAVGLGSGHVDAAAAERTGTPPHRP